MSLILNVIWINVSIIFERIFEKYNFEICRQYTYIYTLKIHRKGGGSVFNFLFLHLKCNVGPIDTCICRQEFFSKRIIMYVGDIHWRNLIFLLSISTLHNDKMNLYIVGLSFYQLLHFLIIINISSINTSNQFIFFGTDHFVKKWWFLYAYVANL